VFIPKTIHPENFIDVDYRQTDTQTDTCDRIIIFVIEVNNSVDCFE